MFFLKKIMFLLIVMACVSIIPVFAQQKCRPDSIEASTPISRFTDNENGTITDIKTGLMWKKCEEGITGSACDGGVASKLTWQKALQRAQEINLNGGFAGYTDWRVPNIKELDSIAERQCFDPSINLSVFPNAQTMYLWSSSPDIRNDYNAFAYSFYNGYFEEMFKYNENSIRLVRSGQ